MTLGQLKKAIADLEQNSSTVPDADGNVPLWGQHLDDLEIELTCFSNSPTIQRVELLLRVDDLGVSQKLIFVQ